MFSITTILHPTDFSEHSDEAFRLAYSLARERNARLVVLHVMEPSPTVYAEGAWVPAVTSVETAHAQLQSIGALAAGVTMERRLKEGDAATEILRSAAEVKADLIVMGTHGRRGLGRLLMGSVAEQILRQAACPVLTVKTPLEAHTVGEPGTPKAALADVR